MKIIIIGILYILTFHIQENTYTCKYTKYNYKFTIYLCHKPIHNWLKHIDILLYFHSFHGESPAAFHAHRDSLQWENFKYTTV